MRDTRTSFVWRTAFTPHRLAHALAGGMLHMRGRSLRERTDDAERLDGFGSHVLVFAAIVTDVAQSTDDSVFASALLGADGTAVVGRRQSGEWTQTPRRLMRLVIEFSVDRGFTPAELVLVALRIKPRPVSRSGSQGARTTAIRTTKPREDSRRP